MAPNLLEVFALSNTELGAVQGVYGIFAMLASRVDRWRIDLARKLLALSLSLSLSLWSTADGFWDTHNCHPPKLDKTLRFATLIVGVLIRPPQRTSTSTRVPARSNFSRGQLGISVSVFSQRALSLRRLRRSRQAGWTPRRRLVPPARRNHPHG